MQIDFPAKNSRKLALHLKERQSRCMPWLKLHQDIDITIWAKIVPQN